MQQRLERHVSSLPEHADPRHPTSNTHHVSFDVTLDGHMMQPIHTHPVRSAVLLVFAGMTLLVLGDMAVSSLADASSASLYRSLLRFSLGAAILVSLTRAGWGREAGVTQLAPTGKKAWGIAFLPLSFYLVANVSGLDGSLHMTPGAFLDWVSMNLAVGLVEEALYRGFALFILLKAWGSTRRGLVLACIVQALLFGPFHLLNLLSGESLGAVLPNAVFATIVGVAFGAAYAYSGSLWTCVVLHALIDMAGSANEAMGIVEHVPEKSFSLSTFLPSLLVLVVVSLLPSLWFAYRSDLRPRTSAAASREA